MCSACRLTRALLFLLVVVAIMGCQNRATVPYGSYEGKDAYRRVAVLPFQKAIPGVPASRPLDAFPQQGGVMGDDVPNTGVIIVEEIFVDSLVQTGGMDVIYPGQTWLTYQRLIKEAGGKVPADLWGTLGRELGVDGVVVGYVYRFRERMGTEYSVEQPASVAFEIDLFRTQDGILAWKQNYDRTQRSLMENVFQASSFFREGGVWLSARALATEGVKDVLKSFPASR